LNHEISLANHLREIADVWHTSIDRWMYASATNWDRKFDVAGYYVRITPQASGDAYHVSRRPYTSRMSRLRKTPAPRVIW
jgi:GH15 family glucan-1,4-alpha-glucosidase